MRELESKVMAGSIIPAKIEAGTIEDTDGSLLRMTEELIADLRHANTLSVGRLQAEAVRAARVEAFNPDDLSPAARAQWDQFGRRMKLMEEFDREHPVLHRFRGWPIMRTIYGNAMRNFVLSREP
jgi:hypothetical protein